MKSRSARKRLALSEPLESRQLLTVLPDGFTDSVVAQNFGLPTAMDVLPDGRVLIAAQDGRLQVVKNGALLSSPFVSVSVDYDGERGLVGVTHDPNFQTNGFVYIYYTVPKTATAAAYNKIVRYTAQGDVAKTGSAVEILRLGDLIEVNTNHNGGAMHFGKDGKLYVGVGENAVPTNSQTLSNLMGKVLRLDVSNVQAGDPVNNVAKLIPSDNPFVNSAQGINKLIYALGFRNPFSFAVNSISGDIFINEVGQNSWEEVNKLVAGGNYGWNQAEGFSNGTPAQLGPGTYQQPFAAYDHATGNCVVGGLFYNATSGMTNAFPSSFNGKFMFADLGGHWLHVLDPATPGTLADPDPSNVFADDTAGSPVDIAQATDGSVYYASRMNNGYLFKISYSASTSGKPSLTLQPANRTISVGGNATFSVTASGAGTLTYQWQRNSGTNGAFVNINGATSPAYTLTAAKTTDTGALFRVVVTNADGSVTSNSAKLTVVTNQSPKLEIFPIGGLRNGKFDAGQPLTFWLAADDVEDGNEPASRFSYKVDYYSSLGTVTGGIERPFVPTTTGEASVSFTPASSGPYTLTDILYRITFTCTDSAGLSSTITQDYLPNTVNLTLQTNPTGLKLNVDGQSKAAPVTIASVVGFTRQLDAPLTQTVGNTKYTFKSWSDGKAASHTVTTPTSNTTYTATYTSSTVNPPPPPPPPTTIRVEAESLRATTFAGEANTAASGGRVLSLKTAVPSNTVTVTGSASGTFNGATGSYLIKAGYFDENDGSSNMTVKIGNTQIASWKANAQLGDFNPVAKTKTTRSLGVFTVTKGSAIIITGSSSNSEYARWDYLEFIPQTTTTTTAPAPQAASGISFSQTPIALIRNVQLLESDSQTIL